MNRACIFVSASLWIAALVWALVGTAAPEVHRVFLAAAITFTVCTALRLRGLSDRELVELGIRAGRSMRADV